MGVYESNTQLECHPEDPELSIEAIQFFTPSSTPEPSGSLAILVTPTRSENRTLHDTSDLGRLSLAWIDGLPLDPLR